jgi:DNA-directed RNA polymerase omega subunit
LYLESAVARVTTESCLRYGNIENRFELVLLASFRARCIESGSALGLAEIGEDDVPLNNKDAVLPVDYASGEKSVVLALREIERGIVNIDLVRELLTKKRSPVEFALEKDSSDAVTEASDEFSGELSDQISDDESLSEDEALCVSDDFEDNSAEDEDLEFD